MSAIAGISEDNGTVFYTANQEDDRQQDLYSSRLDGTATRRLTENTGYNTVDVNRQGTAYVATYSRIDYPPERSLCQLDKPCRQLERPSRAAADYDIRRPELLDFTAEDGTVLHGMLFLPPHSKHKLPLVLAPYGGPGGQLVQEQWSPGKLFAMVLANKGIAVLVVDNRGMSNRGRRFGSAQRFKMGEVELKDQLAALDQTLSRFPQLDSSRLGFWGWSYGGFMALYAMTHSDRFIAGCAGSPVTDWRLYDATYVERFMGLLPENKHSYDQSSNLVNAANLKGHLLITHGLSDVNVHPQNTIRMTDELVRVGISFDMMLYPRQTHHFTDEAELHVFQKFVDHFVRYLQPSSELAESN